LSQKFHNIVKRTWTKKEKKRRMGIPRPGGERVAPGKKGRYKNALKTHAVKNAFKRKD
jgi:hypothetical protein